MDLGVVRQRSKSASAAVSAHSLPLDSHLLTTGPTRSSWHFLDVPTLLSSLHTSLYQIQMRPDHAPELRRCQPVVEGGRFNSRASARITAGRIRWMNGPTVSQ